jgi:outer membrane scaffolding protein for murein synthesis (MipA/OmpV family)
MSRRLPLALAATLGAGLAACAGGALARPANDWTVDAGAGARVRPTHLGSGQFAVDAVPILEATYGDVLSLSFDDGAKWRALRVGQAALGPVAEYRQAFDDKLPPGTPHMSDAVELGGFAEYRTPVGIAEARLRRAVNAYEGWSGEVTFTTGAPVTSGLLLGGQARLSWADSNFTRAYFALPQGSAPDFMSVGAELDAAQQVTRRARVVLELSADRMLGELRPSPLFANRNIRTATLGLTYRWAGPPTGRTP